MYTLYNAILNVTTFGFSLTGLIF